MGLRGRLAGLCAVGASCLLIAGCGGGSSDPSTGAEHSFTVRADTTMATTPGITKAQFIARANKTCRQNWGVVYGNFHEYTGWHADELHGNKLFALGVSNSFLLGFDFHVFDELHLLKAPPAEKANVEAVMGAMQEAVERGERIVHVTTPAQLAHLFADYNQAAQKYGLVDCLVHAQRVRRAQAS